MGVTGATIYCILLNFNQMFLVLIVHLVSYYIEQISCSKKFLNVQIKICLNLSTYFEIYSL